ncbi:S8 family serine peptidase [Micromonospora sp. WMMD1102]|uniref:S8 family serine peptidase n=1 Tax=Micromonospora sp. WMMD1102 TaxID=3016105 RepID=UPI002414D826|nr:S8 family serine peptidase [Micromonospora sp. WMMD1102]MDG4785716.1 S8 family serine peptidase [Micromonospora sp. WMMD1102]
MNPVKRLTWGVTGLALLVTFAVPGPPAGTAALAAPPGQTGYAAAAPTGFPPAAGSPTPPGTGQTDPSAGTGARTVSLVTGDRVTVTADFKASVEPGPGRTGVEFLTRRIGDRLHVIPTDALALVRGGRLDERLFDVTALLEFGYDRRGDLPLLVTYAGADDRAQGGSALVGAGARLVRDLPPVAGQAVTVDRDGLPRFWTGLTGAEPTRRTMAATVRTVWLDGLRRPALAESVPQVGAPAAWAAGFDGSGVTVAVLDTGIDETHPDLAGQVTGQRNFTDGVEDDRDTIGHGTHVASTVAGTGAARFTGVAPGARLLDGKVCAANGCTESAIIAGMQWAAESGARVVNMSLTGTDTPVVDPIEQALGQLTEAHDTLFVVAAGNIPGAGTVGSPATADAALAVGAVSKSDGLAGFSSQGPRLGDGAIKPDLTAPGLEIVAARSVDSGPEVPEGSGIAMSGTSMATPHVAGAAAILAQRRPNLPAPRLKAALMAAARPNPELGVFAQGAGRLDVARAVDQQVTADPPSLSFGRQSWPHDDDTPVRRTVRYHNAGSTPVTMQVGVRAVAPDGVAVPAGMFTVTPSSVTVPAGGTAEATVTADTAGSGGPLGQLTGLLTATVSGGGGVPTPLALDREVESYDVKVAHLGHAGEPTTGYLTMLAGLDRSYAVSMPATGDGTATLRVPKGRYSALTAITSPLDGVYLTSVLAQPELDVSGDRSVVLDARLGRPLSVTVPTSGARQVFAELATSVLAAGRTVEVGTLGSTFERLRTGRVGPDQAAAGFVSRTTATFAPPEPADHSYAYLLCWLDEGRMGSGFTRQVTAAELATVRADHGHESSGSNGRKLAWAVLPESVMGGFAHAMTFPLPSTRTEYYNTDGRAQWFRSVDETTGSGAEQAYLTSLVAPPMTYRPGQAYQEQWSRGVFGPTVAAPPYEHQWVTRLGDTLTVQAPLYGDGVGRAGFSSIATGRITLEHDGKVISDLDGLYGTIELPPETGDYRLTMTAERGGPATLSTRVGVTWTFRSGHVDGETPSRLPISTVRFSPRVDSDNSTPAGQTGTVPVTVTAQPGSGAGANEELTVEVSYDDGVTWAPAEVTAGQAVLRHPAESGYVSLRASATDTAGNTVTQTVIRAYRIG